MSRIVLRDLTKAYGELAIVDPLSLDIESGSFVSIIGPSGCGKTTLLRVIAGLEPATSGEIALDGELPGWKRSHKRVAMVPQQPGLLPWRTVLANARLLLDVNRAANPSGTADTVALLQEVGLGEFMAAYPHELSGGMQQRVALVRALTLHAPLLVMDEPFAALGGDHPRRDARHPQPTGGGPRRHRLVHHAQHQRGRGAQRPGARQQPSAEPVVADIAIDAASVGRCRGRAAFRRTLRHCPPRALHRGMR